MTKRETGELSAGDLLGDRLYEKRARAALPILVRQARAGQPITYASLANELSMPNARNLNYVLGAVGNSMLDLAKEWGGDVPPIQSLVVNQSSGLPGEGLSWFAPDAAEFKSASPQEKRRIVDLMLHEVYSYTGWSQVLKHYGLYEAPPPDHGLDAYGAHPSYGSGEGPEHKALKAAIATHPEWIGLPRSLAPGVQEAPLRSGDFVDVVFENGSRRFAAEVKPACASEADIARGMFQCIKYAAVMTAEANAAQKRQSCEAALVLGGSLPSALVPLRNTLGIVVWQGLSQRLPDDSIKEPD